MLMLEKKKKINRNVVQSKQVEQASKKFVTKRREIKVNSS